MADCEKNLGAKVAKEEISQWLREQLAAQLKNQTTPENFSNIKYIANFSGMHGDGQQRERAADIEARAYVRLPDQRGEACAGAVRFEREIQRNEWRRHMVVASLRTIFTRRFTLEYFAPFLIGLLPTALWIQQSVGWVLIRLS